MQTTINIATYLRSTFAQVSKQVKLRKIHSTPLPSGLKSLSASEKVPIRKKDSINKKIILLNALLELKVKRLAYLEVKFKIVVSAWFRRLFIVALFSLRRD